MLFVALVGLTCSFRLLPPGLLLAAVPVVFVLGLQLVVVSGQLAFVLLPFMQSTAV